VFNWFLVQFAGRHRGSRFRAAALLFAVAVIAFVFAAVGTARAASGLATGFTDFQSFQGADPADRAIALQRAHDAGATYLRLTWSWAGTAPQAPPNIAATTDPAWPGYDWSFLDDVDRQVSAAGFIPIFEFTSAPSWAEGRNKPGNVPDGTWKPDPAAFQAFAEAAARRYSGHYPDPLNPGKSLPAVHYWQAWNEPNLTTYLTPQWARVKGKLTPESPVIYRALLNGFYKGIKKVSRSNKVVTAGTSPFGDLRRGGTRIPPAYFVRELFCLRGRKALKRFRCAGSPVHFDILAHHPYPIGPPRRHAPNPDDVVIADMGRITRPLKVALKRHTVAPRGRKPVWATEFAWETKPPDPNGIPIKLQATYLEGALSELWSEGVSFAGWYDLRDEAPTGGYATTLQSGLYLRAPSIAGDTPKPALTAFDFPFTAYLHRGRAQLWGLAPAPGSVTIQAQHGATWTNVAQLTARSGSRMFTGSKRIAARTVVRAVQGARISLPWTVFSP
jgi:hypothetical protein